MVVFDSAPIPQSRSPWITELAFLYQFRIRGFRAFRTFCQKIRNPHGCRHAVSVRTRVAAWDYSKQLRYFLTPNMSIKTIAVEALEPAVAYRA